MQSPTDDPLFRIQKEISEAVQRESEYKTGNVNLSWQTNGTSNFKERPLQRALSTSTMTLNPSQPIKLSNPELRGIMQRFIKSRGKINISVVSPPVTSWVSPRDISPQRVTVVPEKMIRNGYVPVEERIKKELHEMQSREEELKVHRRRVLAASQPDLLSIMDRPDSPINSLQFTRKIRSLDDEDSAPTSLKSATSLAHIDDLDLSEAPGSSSLIAKFESIIQQNRESFSNL